MQDWLWQSAADLGRGIGTGDIDPVDLCETYLDAIRGHDLRDRIFARLTEDRARAEAAAAAARAKAGQRRGVLDGVPISWKDLFDTAGVGTEAGSALLKGRVPTRDAAVLRNATAAGLVCLGKTHMSELAFSGLGYNPVTATPPSSVDPDGVAGGSSSGAAASVAQGLAAAGIGSDTGGSVRAPAVWNDLVGLKTTSGVLSLEGTVPLAARFDTVGPLCRTVEDAALMLGALGGDAAPDLRGATLQGTRFAILRSLALDDVEGAPMAGFESGVERLRAAGVEVTTIDVPEVVEANDLTTTLLSTEAYGTWRHLIDAKPDLMFHEIRERFRSGAQVLATEFVAGWQRLDTLRAAYLEKTAGFDAAILPTCPILPPKIDRLGSDSDYYRDVNLLTLRNTRIGNLMGLAALTLPTGVPGTGIMLQTPPRTEARLLRLGAAVERALA